MSGNSGERTSLIADVAVTGNGATVGNAVQLAPQAHQKFLVMLISGFTDGSYVVKIEHSTTGNPTDWEDLVTASALAGAGQVSIPFPTTGNLSFVRGTVTASGVTTGATSVQVFTTHSNPIR